MYKVLKSYIQESSLKSKSSCLFYFKTQGALPRALTLASAAETEKGQEEDGTWSLPASCVSRRGGKPGFCTYSVCKWETTLVRRSVA